MGISVWEGLDREILLFAEFAAVATTVVGDRVVAVAVGAVAVDAPSVDIAVAVA